MMLQKIEKTRDLIELRREGVLKNKTLGIVPTMGALHDGHLSLIKASKKDNEITIASIFVNRTQFNNSDDFNNYPNRLEEDLEKLKAAGADYVFCPSYEEIYPDNYRFVMSENTEESRILCGAHRPGHFNGVLSVVLKLFQVSSANRAYFGEKDFQQLRLVKEMAQAYFLTTEVIGVPTLREADGLAMSSRNLNLSNEERALAPELYQTLSNKKLGCDEIRSLLKQKGFQVDYVEEHWGRRFAAATLGKVRLIDNIKL